MDNLSSIHTSLIKYSGGDTVLPGSHANDSVFDKAMYANDFAIPTFMNRYSSSNIILTYKPMRDDAVMNKITQFLRARGSIDYNLLFGHKLIDGQLKIVKMMNEIDHELLKNNGPQEASKFIKQNLGVGFKIDNEYFMDKKTAKKHNIKTGDTLEVGDEKVAVTVMSSKDSKKALSMIEDAVEYRIESKKNEVKEKSGRHAHEKLLSKHSNKASPDLPTVSGANERKVSFIQKRARAEKEAGKSIRGKRQEKRADAKHEVLTHEEKERIKHKAIKHQEKMESASLTAVHSKVEEGVQIKAHDKGDSDRRDLQDIKAKNISSKPRSKM